MTRLRNPIQK